MIPVTETIALKDSELQWDFVRSGGPGGQNVNKVATAVQLRFDVTGSPSLPQEVKERLSRLAGSRMTDEMPPVRSAQERKRDTLQRLAEEIDAWVATAGASGGAPCLAPFSFLWDGASLLIAAPASPAKQPPMNV